MPQLQRDKKRARLNCMQHFLSLLPYPGKDRSIGTGADPLIVGASVHMTERDEHIFSKTVPPALKQSGESA